jgi:hypothetical protein
MKWFDDPVNGQGADDPTNTPATLIDSFTRLATLFVDSFAHDGVAAISDLGPFSMKEQAVFTLTPFAQLSNRGRTEVKTAAFRSLRPGR